MPKLIFRIVALLLLPCLMIDQSLALASPSFETHRFPSVSHVSPLFQEDALSARSWLGGHGILAALVPHGLRSLFRGTRLPKSGSRTASQTIGFRLPLRWDPIPVEGWQTDNGSLFGIPVFSKLPKWQSPIYMMQGHNDGGRDSLGANSSHTYYADDEHLNYASQEIPLTPSEVRITLPSYIGRFLRHINPSHRLVAGKVGAEEPQEVPEIQDPEYVQKIENAISDDQAKTVRISLVHQISPIELQESDVYRRLRNDIMKSNAYRNGKIDFMKEENLHFTIAGDIQNFKRIRDKPMTNEEARQAVEWYKDRLASQSPINVQVRGGVWFTRFIRARGFLKYYPAIDTSKPESNRLTRLILSVGGKDFKVYAMALFQLKASLSVEEASELERLLEPYRGQVMFEYSLRDLSLVEFDNDLLGGKRILGRIQLKPNPPMDHSKSAQQVLALLPKGPARLLSIGVGAGEDEVAFAKLNPNLQIEATTLSQKAVELTKTLAAIENISAQIHPKVEDIRNGIREPDESMDIVYARLSLHYLTPQELRVAFREMYRVLKPEGKIIVVMKSDKDSWATDESAIRDKPVAGMTTYTDPMGNAVLSRHFISPRSLRKYVDQSGFTVVEVKRSKEALFKDVEKTAPDLILASLVTLVASKSMGSKSVGLFKELLSVPFVIAGLVSFMSVLFHRVAISPTKQSILAIRAYLQAA
jgi:ubiquinone/menaquinone biosynthesis C-methylase UbiE